MAKPGAKTVSKVLVLAGLLTFVGSLLTQAGLGWSLAGLAVGFLGLALLHP